MKPIPKALKGARWKIFVHPVVGHTYVIGIDTASGKANSNDSVITVLDVNTGEQVAVIAGQIAPEEVGIEAKKIGEYYNDALIGVEKEYHGVTVINYLRQNGYPNLYAHPAHITSFESHSTEFGWDARRYRQIAIDWLQQDIGWSISTVRDERNKAIWIKDPETISQLGWFIRNAKTGKFEAASGKLDDRVSAIYIANYLRRELWGTVWAPPPPPPRELSFLEKIALNDEVADHRELGKRFYEN
jgi:hypothetical protein